MTSSKPEEQRIALFIDFENIAIGVRDAHYRRFDINLVLERLVEKGKILTKRAYADWGRYGEYRRSFHEAAVELIEVPQKSVGGKNSADIRLVVDAMDMSFQKEHIDCFCIASGDSDFSPLVSKLKENDKYVIGLGVKNSTSDLLMENCDEFIFYEDLVRRQEKPAVVIPNIPEKLQEAFSILVDSVVALQLENKGALWGSMVKETMKRKKPSFNETYYGFRSFSSLLEDAQRRGVVTLRRDQKSGSYIVEDLGAAARGDGAGVPPRPVETDAAGPSDKPGDSGSNGAPGTGSNGHSNGRGDREPRPERRPAPTAPPLVAGSTVAAPVVPASAVIPLVAASIIDDAAMGAEGDGPDNDGPRPRRRRGGRGRGRGREGREGGERERRPDLEASAEDLPLPLDEDSNPSIPTPPQAAAAYAEVVDRMSRTEAPALWAPPAPAGSKDEPKLNGSSTDRESRNVWEEKHSTASAAPLMGSEDSRREEPSQGAVNQTDANDNGAVLSAPKPAGPKPTPTVTPVDPSKASFSLLGWLKGGG
ncbi:MAG: NYN domain-containing protein [Vicinamibacteria bacterium]|nr:NYN domain-containing protein [Vicinamibacteria bacterium]